ncbi:MAG: hypothetical protein ACKODX_06720, partial [Gemmata sp.]
GRARCHSRDRQGRPPQRAPLTVAALYPPAGTKPLLRSLIGLVVHDLVQRDAQVADVFAQAGYEEFGGCDMTGQMGAGHGREEKRYVTVAHDPEGRRAVGRVSARWTTGQKNVGTRHYYITTSRASAAVLAGYIRNHWGIENAQPDNW